MKTILISLVSDQTIPNVQLINEFKKEVDDYLFISTATMEKKGCRKWIENATEINGLNPIVVDPFSFDDIISKLNGFDFSEYKRIIVNLTGGTKVMTLAAHDYFKEEGAEILYITGSGNEYLKVFPGKKKIQYSFSTKITIPDYLKAYGFSLKDSEPCCIDFEYTKKLFNLYCEGKFDDQTQSLLLLRGFRAKGVKEKDWKKASCLQDFIKIIDFVPQNINSLTESETKYLTGEWLEEFIGISIKNELGLTDDELKIGTVLKKDLPQSDQHPARELLGADIELSELKPDNEIDVMFMWKGKFYTIECKTSIIDIRTVIVKGIEKEKEVNILGETIYKADSLKNKFGLFANSNIFTLTSFAEYINHADPGMRKNRIGAMTELINRASLSKITIADKDKIKNSSEIYKLLKE